MNEKYTFKFFLGRNWWFLLLAFVKIFNQSETEGALGPLFRDTLFFGGVLLFIMFAYWFIRYDRRLSSIIKGDVFYFNNNAVPVLNDIFAKLNTPGESPEKEILLKIFATTNGVIDILFNPDTGIIRGKVKFFDKEAFYAIYEIIILFLIWNLKSVKLEGADKLKEIFIEAMGRKDECNKLWNDLESTKDDIRIFKPIFEKIFSYTDGHTREEELAFVSAFHDHVQAFFKLYK